MPDAGFPRVEYENFGGSVTWRAGIPSKWDTESKKNWDLPEVDSRTKYNYYALLTNRFISLSTQGEIIDDRFFRPEMRPIGYNKQSFSNLNVMASPQTFEDATSMYKLSYIDQSTGNPQTRQISGWRYVRQTIRDAQNLYCDLEIEISVPAEFGGRTASLKKPGIPCVGYPTPEMINYY